MDPRAFLIAILFARCSVCGESTRSAEHYYDADRDGCYVSLVPGAAKFYPRKKRG